MGLNRKKYPIHLSRGSSAKYTAYEGSITAAVAVTEAAAATTETGEKSCSTSSGGSEVPKSTTTAAEGSPTNPYRNSATGVLEAPNTSSSSSLHRHLHFSEDSTQQQQQQQQPLAMTTMLGLIASGALCGALVTVIAWRRSVA